MTDEELKIAVRCAETLHEVFETLGVSSVSPEAYYSEIVWEALHPLRGALKELLETAPVRAYVPEDVQNRLWDVLGAPRPYVRTV